MQATLQTFPPTTHTFWDTPGASTSAAPSSRNSPVIFASREHSRSPSSGSPKSSAIDPQLRSTELAPNPNYPRLPPPPPEIDVPGAPGGYPFPQPSSAAPPPHYPYYPLGGVHMLSQPHAGSPTQQHSAQSSGAPPTRSSPHQHAANPPYPVSVRDGRRSPKPESFYAPQAALLYSHAQIAPSPTTGTMSPVVPCRLPPIMQVEKQQVTTTATQAASASRRRNEAHFICPVPGCGSTFTRRFNLRGHLRSHTEERPYVCEWPGCNKGFARQHDCKRHQALHSTKSQNNACPGCGKTFSRLDALNRHLRSEGGSECRQASASQSIAGDSSTGGDTTPSSTSTGKSLKSKPKSERPAKSPADSQQSSNPADHTVSAPSASSDTTPSDCSMN